MDALGATLPESSSGLCFQGPLFRRKVEVTLGQMFCCSKLGPYRRASDRFPPFFLPVSLLGQ